MPGTSTATWSTASVGGSATLWLRCTRFVRRRKFPIRNQYRGVPRRGFALSHFLHFDSTISGSWNRTARRTAVDVHYAFSTDSPHFTGTIAYSLYNTRKTNGRRNGRASSIYRERLQAAHRVVQPPFAFELSSFPLERAGVPRTCTVDIRLACSSQPRCKSVQTPSWPRNSEPIDRLQRWKL